MSATGYAHKVNDYVMYKQSGIFKIIDIREEEFSVIGKKSFYILQSVYDANLTIHNPVDAPGIEEYMRHILSAEEINSLIDDTENTSSEWIDDTKARSAKFNDTLESGDRKQILLMVKMLSLKKIDMEKQKRKIYASDEKLLAIAEKIITEEFAFVLGIPREKVIPYIVERVRKIHKNG